VDVVLLLAFWLVAVAGLALIPFGLPGLWLVVLGAVGYAALTGFREVGAGLLAVAVGLAAAAEALEYLLGMQFASRYGGSRRAGWGALLGGLAGGLVGLPLPVAGSVVGAFLGAFAGAALAQWTQARRWSPSLRAGWGAVLGKAWGTAAKVAVAVAVAVAVTVRAL
jgi:uncharacterized protein YqgC (DUF456 family)